MVSRKQILGAFGALALVVAGAIPAFAAEPVVSDSEDISIVVTSNGVLSVILAVTNPLDDVNYSFTSQHASGELTVTVTDLRGTAAGWILNLRANGDFEGAGTTDSIPIGGLGLAFNHLQWVAGNTSTLTISEPNISHVSTTGQQIANSPAGYGDGQYNIVYFGDLLVPGNTLIDTYTTTLIVEAPAGP